MTVSRFPFHLAVAALAVLAAPRQASAQFTNGQAAFRVIGQTNFTSGAAGATTTTMNSPFGILIDAARGKMYIAELFNHRVTRYAYPVAADGPPAELAFGQPSLTVNTLNNGGLSAASLNNPAGMCLDTSGTLYVCDNSNNRVLAYANAHLVSVNGPSAVRVLGQSSFTAGGADVTSTNMSGPGGVAWEAPDRLWVTDFGNNRVLRFENASQKANGGAADGVLGQPDFTSSGSGTTAATITGPAEVAVTSGTLFVADRQNNRVLRFANAGAKANGAAADGVLGQPNFTSAGASVSATALSRPHGVCVDRSGRLYITDRGNTRVVYHTAAASKADNAAADGVLGQVNFTTSGSGTTANSFAGVFSSAVDSTNNVLAVADLSNNRVVLQQASAPLPVAVSGVSVE